MTSSCKLDALLTRWSPPLNRRKLHPKHQFRYPRQKSDLPSKTNMELNLHCSYCGLLVCNIWRGFMIQRWGNWEWWHLLNQHLRCKIEPCLGRQVRGGKHLDARGTTESVMQLHSSTAHEQMHHCSQCPKNVEAFIFFRLYGSAL